MSDTNGNVEVTFKGKIRWHYVWIAATGLASVFGGHLITNSPTRTEVNTRHEAVDRRLEDQDRKLSDLQDKFDKCQDRADRADEMIGYLMRELDRRYPLPRDRTRRLDPGGGGN